MRAFRVCGRARAACRRRRALPTRLPYLRGSEYVVSLAQYGRQHVPTCVADVGPPVALGGATASYGARAGDRLERFCRSLCCYGYHGGRVSARDSPYNYVPSTAESMPWYGQQIPYCSTGMGGCIPISRPSRVIPVIFSDSARGVPPKVRCPIKTGITVRIH